MKMPHAVVKSYYEHGSTLIVISVELFDTKEEARARMLAILKQPGAKRAHDRRVLVLESEGKGYAYDLAPVTQDQRG